MHLIAICEKEGALHSLAPVRSLAVVQEANNAFQDARPGALINEILEADGGDIPRGVVLKHGIYHFLHLIGVVPRLV